MVQICPQSFYLSRSQTDTQTDTQTNAGKTYSLAFAGIVRKSQRLQIGELLSTYGHYVRLTQLIGNLYSLH